MRAPLRASPPARVSCGTVRQRNTAIMAFEDETTLDPRHAVAGLALRGDRVLAATRGSADAAVDPAGHARHHARRRARSGGDAARRARVRRARRARRPLHAGLRHRAADPAVARLDADRALPGGPRRARERAPLRRARRARRRAAARRRMGDRRVRLGLSARPPVRPRARLRALRRRARRRRERARGGRHHRARARLPGARRLAGRSFYGCTTTTRTSPTSRPSRIARASPDAPNALYLGEIAAMDAELGRLVEAFETRVGAEQSRIVVVGDHGEALGEHGESFHGNLLYQAVVRVPLVVAGGGIAPARSRGAAVDAARLRHRAGLGGPRRRRAQPARRDRRAGARRGDAALPALRLAAAGDGDRRRLEGDPRRRLDRALRRARGPGRGARSRRRCRAAERGAPGAARVSAAVDRCSCRRRARQRGARTAGEPRLLRVDRAAQAHRRRPTTPRHDPPLRRARPRLGTVRPRRLRGRHSRLRAPPGRGPGQSVGRPATGGGALDARARGASGRVLRPRRGDRSDLARPRPLSRAARAARWRLARRRARASSAWWRRCPIGWRRSRGSRACAGSSNASPKRSRSTSG